MHLSVVTITAGKPRRVQAFPAQATCRNIRTMQVHARLNFSAFFCK